MLFLGFLAAFLTSLCITPLIIRLARRKDWIDIPRDSRSMHRKATPRAGGLAVIIAFITGIVFLYLSGINGLLFTVSGHLISCVAFPLGCLIIALTGLYDDAYGIGFKSKFLVQVILAYFMFLAGFKISIPLVPGVIDNSHLQTGIELPLTLLWYLAVINGTNLIDGLDGLASGVALIALYFLATVFGLNGDFSLLPVIIVTAGAVLGFIVYNFNPASIFLGDTGSLFLGFLLATFGVAGTGHSNGWLALAVPAMVIGLPLLETVVTLIRRLISGVSPFAPDKDHIHHRLTEGLNISIKGAVLRLYALNGVLGQFALSLVLANERYAVPLIVVECIFITAVLKKLGYVDLQTSARLIKRRLKANHRNMIPRGQWTQDQATRETSVLIEDSELYSSEELKDRNITEQIVE